MLDEVERYHEEERGGRWGTVRTSSVKTTDVAVYDFCGENDGLCVENDGLCFENDGLCVKNDEFCIKNDEFCIKNDEFRKVEDIPLLRPWLRTLLESRL